MQYRSVTAWSLKTPLFCLSKNDNKLLGINLNLFLQVAKHCFLCCIQEASMVGGVWLGFFCLFICLFHHIGIVFVFYINDWFRTKLEPRTGPVNAVLLYTTCDLETVKQWLREADVQGGAVHALMRTAIFLVLLMVSASWWSGIIDFPSFLPSRWECFLWLMVS